MTITIEDDFDLEKIADSGQCFRWERLGKNSFRIPHRESCLVISQAGRREYALDCSEEAFRRLWKPYFDLEENYQEIRRNISESGDPFLFRASGAEKGIRILRQDFWETAVSFIISQNRNIPTIRKSVFLLCQAAGEKKTDSRGEVFYTFPSPDSILALPEETLAACKLGYRGKYVRAAAEAASAGVLCPEKLSSAGAAEAVKALTAFYGIGVKVASCIALFGLHLLDAFPMDTWIRRIVENEYPEGYPQERYSPYNGVYQQYMFAYYRHCSAVSSSSTEKSALSLSAPT